MSKELLDSNEILLLLTIYSKQGTVWRFEETSVVLTLLSLGLVYQPSFFSYVITDKGQKHLLKLINTEVL